MDSGAQQNPPAPDVHLDTRAHPEAPDSSAPIGGAETTEDAGASHKSADIDKGKAPEVPEVRTIPEPASAGQAAPAAPEQPAPKTPSAEKTPAPAKTTASAKTAAPAKTGTLKIERILKFGTQSAATALAKVASRPSSTLALHLGRAATRPGYRASFFDTPELEGIIPLVTKSDQSLGSLKEHCIKWNDTGNMDTVDSRSKKQAEASATGNSSNILAAKPIPIACKLLSLQQRLHLVADATNVSPFHLYIPSPRKCRLSGIRTSGIFQHLLHLTVFQINYLTYELDPSFKS
jgi:hypothetical protein